MGKYNDIDLSKWKNYDDIISDSLWIINKRDDSGSHKGDYHGNFIPQIPYQMLIRYTKEHECILDAFVGSGTTLIESKKLNRNAIGVDISEEAIKLAKERIDQTKGKGICSRIVGNSANVNLEREFNLIGNGSVQLIFYHPPYWNIIKFNEIKGNIALSNTLDDFLYAFEKVFDNTIEYLDDNRFFSVIIGDVYKNGEWMPLNSYIIQIMMKKGMKLKSIVVKNMEETKAKQNKKAIWRYRSLLGGFFVFAHEYILIFQKPKDKRKNSK